MVISVLHPTYGGDLPSVMTLPAVPADLSGSIVGIISNGKKMTKPFFDHLDRLLREQWAVADVVRLTKSNYSAPAEAELIAQAAEWSVMFAGIGD